VADGCIIEPGATIENSIIGLRSRIGRDVTIRNSVLMGADFYESVDARHGEYASLPPIGIGAGSVVDGAIVDKNCRIGPGVHIINHEQVDDGRVGEHCAIRDGILVVEKAAVVPGNWNS
jgi:glucose-1-phosphate adenylyltransferase